LKEAGGEVVVAGPYTFSDGFSATEVFTPWTAAPTAAPNDWDQLETSCSGSTCDTANGGCAIVLSDDFVMGSY
jgi:hypothetical protein